MDNTTITIREFRCWLQGVEEMQEEDWVPSKAQWTKIRQKIDTIQDAPSTTTLPAKEGTYPRSGVIVPVDDSAVQLQAGPVIPAGPSNLIVPPRSAPSLLGQPKTPDIDTSTKQYESSFV